MSQIFDIGDLRSGYFDDLPIISQWGNIEIVPIRRICISSAQVFQEHAPLAIHDDPGVSFDQ